MPDFRQIGEDIISLNTELCSFNGSHEKLGYRLVQNRYSIKDNRCRQSGKIVGDTQTTIHMPVYYKLNANTVNSI